MFPYSPLFSSLRNSVCNGFEDKFRVAVNVGFNRANILSLREFVALWEVESAYGEKMYHATFKMVKWWIFLLKELCFLLEQCHIIHAKGLQIY